MIQALTIIALIAFLITEEPVALIAFNIFAALWICSFLIKSSTTPISQCPPHKWEEKDNKLACSKCKFMPTGKTDD